jgi:hypothetical protein
VGCARKVKIVRKEKFRKIKSFREKKKKKNIPKVFEMEKNFNTNVSAENAWLGGVQ